ncbi:MAG: ABC transporter ATP-binding protein [Candidatus Thorarchaeota archaeon]
MSTSTRLLEVNDLSMIYRTLQGDVKAVQNVTMHVNRGEAVGIAGESGCGKTSFASSIIQILPRVAKIQSGEIKFRGVDMLGLSKEQFRKQYRWKKISYIFQGAMNALNPIIKVGDQIAETITLHENVSEEEAWERGARLFEMVGLEPGRINNYPFEFSGGMRQRAMIAMALACNPELVIADEPTTALDVTIQAQIMELLKHLQETLDLSFILITHDISVIAETCNRAIIMYGGKIAEIASVDDVFGNPFHPYSEGLIGAIPSMEKAKEKMLTHIPGAPPNLINPPSGCLFHTRCPYAKPRCQQEVPEVREVIPGRFVACHYVDESGFNQ